MTWNNIQWKLRMIMFDCYQMLMGGVDKKVSIFCNNCIGAFVAHDFRLPFNAPTVNLMIPPSDFIEYISNLEYYRNSAVESVESNHNWPVALLGGKIHLHFIHYQTAEEGIVAWKRREARIDMQRMYFVLVETDGCTYEDLEHFDQLPYPNKVALTHIAYPKIKCSYHIKGYEEKDGVTDSYRFHSILPFRKYDEFNWMKFLKRKNV